MATVRKRQESSSPEGRGTHYQSTLWDLSPPTTARSSSLCLWTATRGIPSSSPPSNHTANTVSEALLRHVVPYFGTPRRLLSDRGPEFVSEIWSKLLRSLGIHQVLTSPYHPEGNAINERSHRTLNNMLRARLLEGSSSKAWVDKVPGIMLSLNAMPHEPHGFSASMVATGQEPTLPPDVQQDVHASPAVDDPFRICGGHNPAVAADPPTDGFTIPSLCRQPIPGRKSHLCDDHPF